MGDRANVYIHEGDWPGVYLYTHWDGTELAQTVLQALASNAGQHRLGDAPYLARIIFDAMVGEDQGGEGGYGISARLTDNEHPIIVIDCAARKIGLAHEGQEPLAYQEWAMVPLPGDDFLEAYANA